MKKKYNKRISPELAPGTRQWGDCQGGRGGSSPPLGKPGVHTPGAVKNLITSEIRKLFLDYFARQGHTVVPSSSLVPADDPTLFFTNAGMVQFKNVFLGKEKRKYNRAVSSQRCLRASGKHNDLENVGYTNRHHTFFEMLGNFSFGDYFKKEAVHYAWEFLTVELGIPAQKLWVTVHKKDKEAESLWQEEFKRTKTSPQGLSYCGDEDNFWAMGDVGPCGYCSEIFYDHGDKFSGDPPGGKNEGERYVEIWNLVFMQFERDAKGKLQELPKPSVDTGMGLERIAAVMQGVNDNYATDTFLELHNKFIEVLRAKFNIKSQALESEEAKIASRVVSDHIRSVVLLIADGIIPSNEKSGYVLRSIIRRATYYLYRMGIKEPLFFQLVYPVTAMMGKVYPEINLEKMQDRIANIIEQEEIRFLDTLDRGLKILGEEISKLKGKTIPGRVAFNLHDTYGLPIILTTEIAKKRGLKLDHEGFAKEMAKQQETSRAASNFEAIKGMNLEIDTSTKFVGFTENKCGAKIVGLFTKEGLPVNTLNLGEEGIIVLDKTPFYAESGGQVGDSGEVYNEAFAFIVQDTQKYEKVHLHYGSLIKGSLSLHEKVTAEIDVKRRQMIKLNHSATHLLHHGLHLVLGDRATQRGSFVDDKRLRFDFNHQAALTAEELREIENIVNTQIRASLEVETAIKTLEDAKKGGAKAIFGEKYADKVRVVKMGNFSQELCGGTHINNTGEIGLFKIIDETSVAAGIRRIEAVTGENALSEINRVDNGIQKASAMLGVGKEQLIDKIEQILKEKRNQEKELECLRNEGMRFKIKELAGQAVKVKDIFVLATKLDDFDSKMLRQMVDGLKKELSSAVIVLAVVNNNKIQLVVGVTSDLINKVSACELLQDIAKKVDGSGGGRADFAQGGGTKASSLKEALDTVVSWVEGKGVKS